MDEASYRAQLERLGGEPRHARWDAGYSRSEHVHPFDAHGLVLRGAFTLTTASGVRRLQAGEVFELAAGVAHSETAGPEGTELLFAAIAPR